MISMLVAALVAAFSLSSCVSREVPSVDRENLFQLSFGRMEDQIDLMGLEGRSRSLKTRISMRDGIFYIVDANGSKIVKYTSYGDLLSMVYDPDTNPPPLNLKGNADTSDVITGRATPYPLYSPGEIAVNTKKDFFVEDRLPPQRRTWDAEHRTLLDGVVLRFDNEGRFLEYLGQEGIGGTPFPMITGLYLSNDDELAVICRHAQGWNVYWFDKTGNLLFLVIIERDDLPIPEGSRSQASLESIIPDPDGRKLFLKIDYYKDTVDESTNTRAGIGYDGSKVWVMDVATGSYDSSIDIPVLERYEMDGDRRVAAEHIYSFLGVANGGKLFFYSPDEGGYALLVMETGSKDRKTGFIRVDAEELMFNTFHLSTDGILSALLATEFEAKIVWWRTDRLIGEPRT